MWIIVLQNTIQPIQLKPALVLPFPSHPLFSGSGEVPPAHLVKCSTRWALIMYF